MSDPYNQQIPQHVDDTAPFVSYEVQSGQKKDVPATDWLVPLVLFFAGIFTFWAGCGPCIQASGCFMFKSRKTDGGKVICILQSVVSTLMCIIYTVVILSCLIGLVVFLFTTIASAASR